MFDDVRTMSSEELVRVMHDNPEKFGDWLVVDVRSRPERSVSQIPGSITQDECHEKLRRNHRGQTVVAYCTVGYRSGLVASTIQEMYPESAVYNLDGILAYSHEVMKFMGRSSADGMCQTLSPLDRVHCFGAQWALLVPTSVSTTHFRGLELARRLAHVGWMRLSRNVKQLLRRRLGLGCLRAAS
jgi:rhodanese-related sulfurtransferase